MSEESALHFLVRLLLENLFFFLPMALFGFTSFSRRTGIRYGGMALAVGYAFLTLFGPLITGNKAAAIHFIFECFGFVCGASIQLAVRSRVTKESEGSER